LFSFIGEYVNYWNNYLLFINNIMSTISAMRIYAAVVEANGFSAAAKVLGKPLSTVSKKVADLESQLGAQLLIRTTRKVTTDSGRQYYEDVRQILDDIDMAERHVSGEYRQPKGRLTITAPTMFGRLHILPIVNQFLQAHQHIDIDLLLTNFVVDLVGEHINLGVRIGTLSDSSMIAKRAGTIRQIVCASPEYLSQCGVPQCPEDIANHRSILISWNGTPVEWNFRVGGKSINFIPDNSRLMINTVEGVVDAAIQNGGLAQLYSYQIASHISSGALQAVIDDYEADSLPVNFVYPQGRFAPQKVRAFIDFAVPRLRKSLEIIEFQCTT
jgi:DNA-binding transcriptional LysR family regulator